MPFMTLDGRGFQGLTVGGGGELLDAGSRRLQEFVQKVEAQVVGGGLRSPRRI